MQHGKPIHRLTLIAAGMLLAASGCVSPNSLAALNDQINQASDAMNALQMSIATMESSLDSLRMVVAKQDTTIGRLANAAGIAVVK